MASAADQAIESQSFDLCVIEATPGGVACAVRAAREGLSVLLVNRTHHLGGILSSGLGVWDTTWEGKRSPLYDELRQAIFDHYRNEYGETSAQYRHSLAGKSGHTNGKFEPRVVEQLVHEMVKREPKVTLLTGYIPIAVERSGRRIESLSLREFRGDQEIQVKAQTFADCTYEGDVMPLAKVNYRVGRESREEFGEPHAGVIYLRPTKEKPKSISEELLKAHQRLNLRKFPGYQEIVLPESTGAGDGNVQAFNYRTVLTSDPDNLIPIPKPANYDPAILKTLEYGSIVQPLPNEKIGWNRPQLVGPHQDYVEGDWQTRERVMDAHWDATMALLYFLQHDPSVPKEKQAYWIRFGLAKDEFADNGHRPYEIYVREGRRLVGRETLTQHDLMPQQGGTRPPTHADAIAISDWYADSHAVTPGKVRDSLDEGKMMLHAETWPGQIPWRCLLPVDLDNFIVPVCFSATHVAWGAIRLEPTWMQTGEATGFAIALAKRENVPPAALDPDLLVQTLARKNFLLTFCNDIDVSHPGPLSQAVQYFGTRGEFPDFETGIDTPAKGEALVKRWQAIAN